METSSSERPPSADAFAEVDRLATEMLRTGASSDAGELIVIDADDRVVQRPLHTEAARREWIVAKVGGTSFVRRRPDGTFV